MELNKISHKNLPRIVHLIINLLHFPGSLCLHCLWSCLAYHIETASLFCLTIQHFGCHGFLTVNLWRSKETRHCHHHVKQLSATGGGILAQQTKTKQLQRLCPDLLCQSLHIFMVAKWKHYICENFTCEKCLLTVQESDTLLITDWSMKLVARGTTERSIFAQEVNVIWIYFSLTSRWYLVTHNGNIDLIKYLSFSLLLCKCVICRMLLLNELK